MKQTSSRSFDFTRGGIIRPLILFTIPIVVGELLQSLYNSVDALIIGNFAGPAPLAAVSACGQPVQLVVGFFNGMSVGTMVVIGRHFGKGEESRSGSLQTETGDGGLAVSVRVAFTLSVFLGLFLSAVACLAVPLISAIQNFPDDVRGLAELYLRLYFIGMVFIVVYNNGTGILRAMGDARTPFRILTATCILNVFLDLFFVAVLKTGVAGVAIATTLSQMVSALLLSRRLREMLGESCFSPPLLKANGAMVSEIFSIGLPSGMQSALISFSNLFVWRHIGGFGTAAMAGIGVAQKLDKFIALPCKSFGTAVTAFVSQNVGARNEDRARRGTMSCLMLAILVTYGLSVPVYLFADTFVGLFNRADDVITIGAAFMRFVIPFYGFMGLREVMLGVLRGHGHSKIPMLLSLFGMVVLRQIYLAWAMTDHPRVENIYFCYPMAWACTALLVTGYYLYVRGRFEAEKQPLSR